jgi:hypothetical protein
VHTEPLAQQDRLANRTGDDELSRLDMRRSKEPIVVYPYHEVRLRGRGDELVALLDRRRHGLLEQDMFTSRKCSAADREVKVMREADGDDIYVLAGKHILDLRRGGNAKGVARPPALSSIDIAANRQHG